MRVLLINDISCIGKCSLTVALPIVSACGVTVDVLPTAVLSTHTGGFQGYVFNDFTDNMPKYINHWKTLGIKYDIIYSGYLGSKKQISIVKELISEFLVENGRVIVDPVMGDKGKLYANFDGDFVEEMKSLCKLATYITPNWTESCFLTNKDYLKASSKEVLEELLKITKCPIITGVEENNEYSVNYYLNGFKKCVQQKIEGDFHGAGDVYTSALCGCLANELDVEKSIELSSQFTLKSIIRSKEEVLDRRYGLNFEKELVDFVLSIRA